MTEKRKITRIVIAFVSAIVTLFVTGILARYVTPLIAKTPGQISVLNQAYAAVFSVIVCIALGYKKVFKFNFSEYLARCKKDKKNCISLIIGVFIVIAFAIYLTSDAIALPGSEVIYIVIMMLLIGICEEAFFRGALLNTLLDYYGKDDEKKIFKALIVSAVMFGLFHLANINSFLAIFLCIAQCIINIPAGYILGGTYLRTRSIWPCALMHASVDLFLFVAQGMLEGKTEMQMMVTSISVDVCFVILITSLCLLILRKKKLTEVADYYKTECD
ncbi:MAG: CPBP family intramembrane metalloprotease [Clostridia bacterium]|nr:CPBP family intramembrane metalloprotease [Clostridia bacterium]